MNQLVQLAAALPQFQARRAELIALAVQDQAGAKSAAAMSGATYPILADPEHRAADAYGVYNRLGDGLATPAVFIIDPSGRIVWSYIGQNANDRPGPETILEHLPAE